MGNQRRKRNRQRNQSKNGYDVTDEKEPDVDYVIASILKKHPRFKSDKNILMTVIDQMKLKYFDPNDAKLNMDLMDKITKIKLLQMVPDETSDSNAVDDEENEDDQEEDEDDDDDEDEDDYNGKEEDESMDQKDSSESMREKTESTSVDDEVDEDDDDDDDDKKSESVPREEPQREKKRKRRRNRKKKKQIVDRAAIRSPSIEQKSPE